MKFFGASKHSDNDPVSQARVDGIVAAARAQAPVAVKRPLFREPLNAPLLPSTNPLDRRIEEELAFARRSLEAMGDALCEDPILLMRHGVQLQTVDLLAQILGHLGSIIGAEDRYDAIARVGMMELRNRLTRADGNATGGTSSLHRSGANPFNADKVSTYATHSGTSAPAGPVRASAK
jgi:hypothetical protein